MQEIATHILIGGLGIACGYLLRLAWQGAAATETAPPMRSPGLYELAGELEDFWTQSAHPRDLLPREAFQRGVGLLRSSRQTPEVVLAYALGANAIISCMAFEALREKKDEIEQVERILRELNEFSSWRRFFALRALEASDREALIPQVLGRLDPSWHAALLEDTAESFLRARLSGGEEPDIEKLAEILSAAEDPKWLAHLLTRVEDAFGSENSFADLSARFEALRAEQPEAAEEDILTAFGHSLAPEAQASDSGLLADAAARKRLEQMQSALDQSPPRSLLLVGEPGVGRRNALELLSRELRGDGWTVFRANAVELMAGQTFMGELENRLQQLITRLQEPKVVWIIDSLHELLHAGRHRYNPTGVLDMIFPYVEAGSVRIIGTLEPSAYERLVAEKPQLRGAFLTLAFQPYEDAATLTAARDWLQRVGAHITEPTLREAHQLSRQYLREKNPGGLLRLLRLTLEGAKNAPGPHQTAITHDRLLETLSQLTSLPRSILDERETLRLDDLEDLFSRRVLGQPEAVKCLVERVAMMKAGLTDPTRPQGVFLFTGPTGTGKTEIAKTLAEFLFGSPDRMIRLDMSELQNWESLSRIVGDGDPVSEQSSLVSRIREQPFSVVLLDELEKAHPNVWDVFLQFFDDGRLTDAHGRTADGRHAFVILTSNVTADVERSETIGFRPDARDPTGSSRAALTEVFRPEFLNRLDHVVHFRPLSRRVMRKVLEKELQEALHRRGLVNRQWAVEWDESALEFLLAKGFSEIYGARPLKRAVDRYLLSPLAMTIVRHQVPAGDQFLFVRSDGQKIQVEFVDPDAPEPGSLDDALTDLKAEPAAETLRARTIALRPVGTAGEVEWLQRLYGELLARTEEDGWRSTKADALEQLSRPEFWNSTERYEVLERVEYRDRIEAGLKTAGSLLRRLIGRAPGGRQQFAAEMIGRLAQHLYLIREAQDGLQAGDPTDAFLLVEAVHDSRTDVAAVSIFAQRVRKMYSRWSTKRGMALEALEEGGGTASTPYRFVATASGYAVYRLLKPESGLHVLETGAENKLSQRLRVRVGVAPQPATPAARQQGAALAQALEALAAAAEPTRTEVTRRYREAPSPLVRDSRWGWRTGWIERVFDGDFDLFVPGPPVE